MISQPVIETCNLSHFTCQFAFFSTSSILFSISSNILSLLALMLSTTCWIAWILVSLIISFLKTSFTSWWDVEILKVNEAYYFLSILEICDLTAFVFDSSANTIIRTYSLLIISYYIFIKKLLLMKINRK